MFLSLFWLNLVSTFPFSKLVYFLRDICLLASPVSLTTNWLALSCLAMTSCYRVLWQWRIGQGIWRRNGLQTSWLATWRILWWPQGRCKGITNAFCSDCLYIFHTNQLELHVTCLRTILFYNIPTARDNHKLIQNQAWAEANCCNPTGWDYCTIPHRCSTT